ncbi:MAG: hypothetical protein WCO48_01145 [Candidatus Taylorbacteria bacterium]
MEPNPISGTVSNMSPKNKKIAIIAAVVIVIAVIIILVRSGGKTTNPAPVDTSSTSGTSRSSQAAFDTNLNQVDFAAPVNPTSSKDLSANDKKAIYQALLNGYKTMTSKNASTIRTYMTAKASTPAEKNLVTKMTDADLVSLSTRLASTMIMPTPDLFLTSSSVWTKDGSAVTIEYADPGTGTTTKRVVNINGQWY